MPSITSARLPLREDVGRRTSRYLVSMAIRTACVVAAVLADGALRWAFLAGAVVLPYLAVVLANAGRERVQTPPAYLDPTAITAGPAVPPPAAPPQDANPDDSPEGVDPRAG